MRTLLLTAALALSSLPALGHASDAQRPTFINSHISSTKIALNQPVRVEFTTMPRQIDGIDIASSVANALSLGAGRSWRLLGRPVVGEHEKTKTITVVMSLLARAPGDLQLPDVPMTWLQGNQVAHFDVVVVSDSIQIGGASRDLPKEVTGIAGFAWGAKLAEVKERIPPEQIENKTDRVLVHPQKNLTLAFIGGGLAQATLIAPGLGLDQARTSFLERWGVPQIEDEKSLTWILGWTRITATPSDDNSGITLALVREDIQANLNKTQVSAEVFGVLEGPVQETKEQAEKRKAKEAEQELERPPVPAR